MNEREEFTVDGYAKWRGAYKWGDPQLAGDISYFDDSQKKQRRMAAAAKAYRESLSPKVLEFKFPEHGTTVDGTYDMLVIWEDGGYGHAHGKYMPLDCQPFATQKEWYERFGLIVEKPGMFDDTARISLDGDKRVAADFTEWERREIFAEALLDCMDKDDADYAETKQRLFEFCEGLNDDWLEDCNDVMSMVLEDYVCGGA